MATEQRPTTPERAVIRTIAKEAGVSVATVSRVANNLPNVTPRTREKVLAVMKTHNYRPNFFARGLNRQISSKLVGLVLPDAQNIFSNHYYVSEILRGLEAAGKRNGYGLVFGLPPLNQLEEIPASPLLELIDGLILISSRIGDPLVPVLDRLRKPYLLLNCVSWKAGSVDINNLAGAAELIEHLIAHGHRRIGFIAGPAEHAVAQERFIGYKSTLRRYGLATPDEWVVAGSLDREGGRRAAQALWSQAERPTALVAASDDSAIGALEWFKSQKISVPQDVAVVGFDDIPSASLITPGLTTVRQPLFQMGEQALDLMAQQLSSPPETVSKTILTPALAVRRSCGCP